MDKPKALNTVLNIMIFLIVFSIVMGVILTILTFSGISYDFVDSEIFKAYKTNTPGIYFFMLLTLSVYFIFVFGLFKLKKAANLFLENNFYSPELAKSIDISGKCMVISGVFWWFLGSLSSMLFEKSISIVVSDKTFVYLFFIAVGLFMMLISKVCSNAIKLKEENDLTI